MFFCLESLLTALLLSFSVYSCRSNMYSISTIKTSKTQTKKKAASAAIFVVVNSH